MADAAKLKANIVALKITTLFMRLIPFLNSRAVNSLVFPRVGKPQNLKVTPAFGLDSFQGSSDLFFSGWAGLAIRFMEQIDATVTEAAWAVVRAFLNWREQCLHHGEPATVTRTGESIFRGISCRGDLAHWCITASRFAPVVPGRIVSTILQ